MAVVVKVKVKVSEGEMPMNARKRFICRGFWMCLVAVGLCFSGPAQAQTKITSIDFKGTGDPQTVEITVDGSMTVEKQENTADNQVILEFKNATIAPSASRKIDTSSFNSKVLLISPYKPVGQSDTVRVVVQMRGAADTQFNVNGDKAVLTVSGGAISASARTEAKESAQENSTSQEASSSPAVSGANITTMDSVPPQESAAATSQGTQSTLPTHAETSTPKSSGSSSSP